MRDSIAAKVEQQIFQEADKRIREAAYEAAKRLKAYIQYEYTISNMELASSSKMHGYDFEILPQKFIDNIDITPVAKDGNRYSLNICIPAESLQGEDQSKIDFFKKYALTNALNKIQTIYGGDIR